MHRRLFGSIGFAVLIFLLSGYAALEAQQRSCGNEGEEACGLFERDLFNQACDSGLRSSLESCGCLLRGFFGNCLLPRLCTMCRNDVRHRPATAAQYAASWADWALRNQRDQLATDEPLNWVMRFATHNAFNSHSDGHQPRALDIVGSQIVDAPNHFYSMTDQLNLGSRALALDAHWVGPPYDARLCHSFTELGPTVESLICLMPSVFAAQEFPSMRYFANGIKEIRNWLRRHPNEIVILGLENYVGDCEGCQGGGEPAKPYIYEPMQAYLGSWLLPVAAESGQPLPSRAELLAMGKRVVVLSDNPVAPAFEHLQSSLVSGAFPVWTRNNQNFDECTDKIPDGDNHGGPALALPGQFSLVVEDRTLQSGFLGLAGQAFGVISVDDMVRMARCNYSLIFTDFLGSHQILGRSADIPDFARHEAAVWSWKPGDKGQNGDCAMVEASSGRWVSSDCTQSRHYVCAPPRSESGTEDRSAWLQREARWRITAASGPWEGGPAACAAEFPFDPIESTAYVFSVPVNGYQNDRLKDANVDNLDVWLNYTDRTKEGSWVIPRLANVNTPPVADAGPDRTVTCGNETVLDGSASVDADGDPLAYTWTGPFGTLSGAVVNVRLGAGVNVIVLTVQDGKGGVSTDSVSITVVDTTPPTLSVSLSPSVLWPANHDLVNVVADVRAQDGCDGSDVVIELRSIVSSEPDNSRGDGNSGPDIQDAAFGTGDLEFSLRAERSGQGPGRVYTVTYRATDKSGNTTETVSTVVVPHDKRRADHSS